MTNHFFVDHLERMPVVAILRGMTPDATVAVATSCWDAGIDLVEVPSQGAAGLRALEAAATAAAARGALVGAGTVYTVPDAARARDAGAAFLVAPGLDDDTAAFAAEHRLPYLPGVATPTEVQRALTMGLSTLKLFPAGPLGPGWLAALRGPFPEVGLVAVGGVSPADAGDYLAAGAVGVGIGSAITEPGAVARLAALRERTAART
ncbi:bifunctional 4-hydroxy-2-oxoglutarate aldolase/2-dehydro-3-deoxy-phosphogluconate aldolase [Blastococcus atacamensis]|uniref:bifunctional 4-hydroxy-2-oxoglutarate aldolase/2-dehydro-3-deoxy-phosphogluconate aldolase n=1 Tax=Blastococcus atacamensis TaxID=2070508 RepID=UPI0018E44791|nr:2-dehydro-3-deoxyphosphogluconate aldolase [Blastococcus atacamensis]